MGKSADDRPITPVEGSWAWEQQLIREARDRVVYLIAKEVYDSAVRWTCYRIHADGGRTSLGHQPTLIGAENAMMLLAGWSGKVFIDRGER